MIFFLYDLAVVGGLPQREGAPLRIHTEGHLGINHGWLRTYLLDGVRLAERKGQQAGCPDCGGMEVGRIMP